MFASETHNFIRVFLSGPRTGLDQEWQLARQALQTMDCVVETMEYWSPESRPPMEVIRDRIRRSHVFVLLIKDDTGEPLPADFNKEPNCEYETYTEYEFYLAKELHIPYLSFFLTPKKDKGADEKARADRVARFRNKVQADKRVTASLCESDQDFLIKLMDGMQREVSRLVRGSLCDRLQFELRKDYEVKKDELGRGDIAMTFEVKSWSGDTSPIAARVVAYDAEFNNPQVRSFELKGDGIVQVFHHGVNRLLGIEYWQCL